jgi:hypothetical protein
MKRLIPMALVLVVGLAIGVGYSILLPGNVAAGPNSCTCRCDDRAPYLMPTPLCGGGMGWFSDPCNLDSVIKRCNAHGCVGDPIFDGCLDP